RLIREEGLLVGGSSGSAMAAMVRAIKDLGLGKDDVVVVVLPDSIRSYLSKFVDDDWLAANDLLPPTPPLTPTMQPSKTTQNRFENATIRDLRLKPVTSILSDSSCADAIETMRDKGFDQLPVSSPTGSRLVGLVTLGNLLSYISSGRATAEDPVSAVMFDFTRLDEAAMDPAQSITVETPEQRKRKVERERRGAGSERESFPRRKGFVEITRDTPLSALGKFFEWNSAAIVTGAQGGGAGGGKAGMKAVAVVTKVDLLAWLVKVGRQNGDRKE
ncbi:hypothetical protein LTR28_009373, partial [Elasticomyces elasticus]